MYSLLIDFETTGIDTSVDRVIEIGAQVVDESWNVLAQCSVLVKGDDYPTLTTDIQDITGITQEDLDKNGKSIEEAWSLLDSIIPDDLQYAIAFNKQFDESIFRAEAARHVLTMKRGLNILAQVPWVCAMVDVETNYMYKSWKLSHLALEYGVAVNPKELHRAINDVELMRKTLIAMGTSSQKMLSFQQVPWIYVAAKIEKPWIDGGKSKNEATKNGYSWEKAKGDDKQFPKTWVKRIKAHQLELEMKKVPFQIVEIKGA